jgi:hypothetical protein
MLWNEGQVTLLPTVQGNQLLLDVNDAGEGVGFVQSVFGSVFANHPMLWRTGGVIDLGAPFNNAEYSEAHGINNYGVIVGTAGSGSAARAAIWTVRPDPGATPSGSDVSVSPIDPATSLSPVTLTFGFVATGGQTSVTTTSQGTPPPLGFKLGSPPVYYELSTTATYSGAITVCFSYSEINLAKPANLKLFHGNPGGTWTDVTTSNNTATRVICGSVTSLSPFVLAELRYDFTGFLQPVDNPGATNTVNRVKAGAAVPVKFSLGGAVGLDIFAAGNPGSKVVACGSLAEVDNIEQTSTAGASSLSYDPASGQYTYVWKTDKAWASTCRQLVVGLKDGTTHSALFNFVK